MSVQTPSRNRPETVGPVLLVFCLSLFLITAAAAQEVVGTTMVDGEEVELLSDQTWRYSAPQAVGDCRPVKGPISFCGATRNWQQVPPTTADITAQYRYDDRNYAMLLIENLGTSSGLSTKAMRNVAIQHAADASGVPVEQVPVFGSSAVVIDTKPARTVIYGANVFGLDFVYRNSILSFPDYTAQLITYAIEAEPSEASAAIHREFLDEVRVEK